MERREAMRNVALLLGGTISASTFSVLFESCTVTQNKEVRAKLFSADQESLITEIAEVIMPETDTPGAKAAGVGPFIAMMLRDCYPDDVQKTFVEGLEEVNKLSVSGHGNVFMNLGIPERNAVLKQIAGNTIKLKKADKEKERNDAAKNNNYPEKQKIKSKGTSTGGKSYFFELIRELTILGYFTSEAGATKAAAYLPVPGRYDGCVDLQPEQKVWAL